MATSNLGHAYYKLLSEPDDALRCLICLDIAEEPWQHADCGRLFCKKCLFQYGSDKPCPNCRMDQPQYFQDNRSKREIKSLGVKCHACSWEGTVSTVEEHIATCQFTLLPCPNQCKGETRHVMRKDLEDHMKKDCPNRDYMCEYCGEKGSYANITQAHHSVCEMKVVPCTNTECLNMVPYQHVMEHLESECEYTVVACKHKSIGCGIELKRKDMPAHEQDDTLHLHMAISTISMMKDDVINMKKEFEKTVRRLDQNMIQSKAAISQLEKIMSKNNTVIPKQEESISFVFPDYSRRKQRKKEFTFPSFYTSQGYHMTLMVHANGDGDGKGTHVSVFVFAVKGKHDDYLRWPIVASITITLLNQLEDDHHYSKVVTSTGRENLTVGDNLGLTQFIPHTALGYDRIKNTLYLMDDTLYFRVEVQHGKPWLQCTNI